MRYLINLKKINGIPKTHGMIEQKSMLKYHCIYSKYVVTFRMTSSLSGTGLHPGLRSFATISIEYATQVKPNIMVISLSHCMAYYSLFCYQSPNDAAMP